MTESPHQQREWRDALVIVVIATICIWFMPPTAYASANIVIAAMALLALLVQSPISAMSMMVTLVVLTRPSVLFWGEIASIMATGLVLLLCARFVVFTRTIIIVWLFVAVGNCVLWTIQTGVGWVTSPIFFMELLYTILFSTAVFFIVTWQRKISF